MIEFDRVWYTYPQLSRPTLHDVTLRIEEGEFALVAGPSGAGKSTLLRCINGLVPHFYGGTWQGRVRVAGRDTREHEPRSLSDVVGFVFQDPEAQMVVEVVEDELVFGMENLRLDPRLMRRRVEEVLDQLEIAHLRRRRLSTLSGGERQRVAIAAVLTTQPRVLVLDEPTSQLDPHTAEEVLTALQKLNADLGLTIVLSEHRLERVVQYVDRIIFCRGPDDAEPAGLISGTPREVLATAPFAPPLVEVGRAAGWEPLPLTIKAARRFAAPLALPPAPVGEPEAHASPRKRMWPRREPAPTVTPTLAVAGLHVTLDGRDVLHGINIDARAGEILAIMGRNGSGKTTLLRAIMGLVPPASGAIAIDGHDLASLSTEARARSIGYVPQDPRTLLFQPTVRQELAWTLDVSGNAAATGAPAADPVEPLLVRFGLERYAGAHPRDLSSGEQQRVALATALVRDPRLLLLDEPTRGLDYLNKHKLIAALRELRAEQRAILLVTHDVELVAMCADRIVLMGDGEVVTEGPARALLHDSLIFSSQIGKLFPRQQWLTAEEAIAGLRAHTPSKQPSML